MDENPKQINSCQIAVIIVHYGSISVTDLCLKSLVRHAPDVNIIIVNNGGNEAHTELTALRQDRYPDQKIQIITLSRNNGFSAGCNAGIKTALKETEISWIWLLNNDAFITSGTLDALTSEWLRFPESIIGATILHANTPARIQVAGGCSYNSATSIIRTHHQNRHIRRLPSLPRLEMQYISGVSMFMSRKLVESVGEMDERFFLYFEEADYCRRAIASGYSLRWCRNAFIFHKGSASIGSDNTNPMGASSLSTFHETRSAVLMTAKHLPVCLPVLLLSRSIGKIGILFIRKQFPLIPAVVSGLISAFSYRS